MKKDRTPSTTKNDVMKMQKELINRSNQKICDMIISSSVDDRPIDVGSNFQNLNEYENEHLKSSTMTKNLATEPRDLTSGGFTKFMLPG